jgi:hypothetical protein
MHAPHCHTQAALAARTARTVALLRKQEIADAAAAQREAALVQTALQKLSQERARIQLDLQHAHTINAAKHRVVEERALKSARYAEKRYTQVSTAAVCTASVKGVSSACCDSTTRFAVRSAAAAHNAL